MEARARPGVVIGVAVVALGQDGNLLAELGKEDDRGRVSERTGFMIPAHGPHPTTVPDPQPLTIAIATTLGVTAGDGTDMTGRAALLQLESHCRAGVERQRDA